MIHSQKFNCLYENKLIIKMRRCLNCNMEVQRKKVLKLKPPRNRKIIIDITPIIHYLIFRKWFAIGYYLQHSNSSEKRKYG